MPKTMSEESVAYRLGYRRGYRGDDLLEYNPYKKYTDDYNEWDRGEFDGRLVRAKSGMYDFKGGGSGWGGFTSYK